MKVRIDSEGRVRIPKAIREAVGLVPGSTVEITEYGGDITILPGGTTVAIEEGPNGFSVARGSTALTEEEITVLICYDHGFSNAVVSNR